MKIIRLFILVTALAAAPAAASAAPIRCGDDGEGGACIWGRAEGVETGAVLVRGLRVQLVGITAPGPRELCFAKVEFPCAKPARKRMAELVSKGIACDIMDTGGDSLYGRCRVAEGDLGRLMVQAGLAKAAKDGPYEADQASALRDRKGLWAAEITLPKDWESARKRQDKD